MIRDPGKLLPNPKEAKVCSDYLVVDNTVDMGTVNNCNNTWHVLICVV